jgi:hypothetical protein
MAKYITPTLTITSNRYDASSNPGPTSTPYNISVTDLLDVTQVDSKIVTVAVTPEGTLFDASDYTASVTAGTDGGYVFLRNLATTAHIYIGHASTGYPTGSGELHDGANDDGYRIMTLLPGEFAFFPWDMKGDLIYDASAAADDALEAVLFVRTGTA